MVAKTGESPPWRSDRNEVEAFEVRGKRANLPSEVVSRGSKHVVSVRVGRPLGVDAAPLRVVMAPERLAHEDEAAVGRLLLSSSHDFRDRSASHACALPT